MPKIIDESKIFNAAIDVMMTRGYEGATTRDIAILAGVNEVTLFRRYGTKAGLFAAAIDNQLANTPLEKLSYSGDLEADMLAIVKAYIETNEKHGDIVLFILLELPRNPELRHAFNTPLNNIQHIAKIIQKHQQQGWLKKESPMVTLSALIGPIMINHLARRANLGLPIPEIDSKSFTLAFLNGRMR